MSQNMSQNINAIKNHIDVSTLEDSAELKDFIDKLSKCELIDTNIYIITIYLIHLFENHLQTFIDVCTELYFQSDSYCFNFIEIQLRESHGENKFTHVINRIKNLQRNLTHLQCSTCDFNFEVTNIDGTDTIVINRNKTINHYVNDFNQCNKIIRSVVCETHFYDGEEYTPYLYILFNDHVLQCYKITGKHRLKFTLLNTYDKIKQIMYCEEGVAVITSENNFCKISQGKKYSLVSCNVKTMLHRAYGIIFVIDTDNILTSYDTKFLSPNRIRNESSFPLFSDAQNYISIGNDTKCYSCVNYHEFTLRYMSDDEVFKTHRFRLSRNVLYDAKNNECDNFINDWNHYTHRYFEYDGYFEPTTFNIEQLVGFEIKKYECYSGYSKLLLLCVWNYDGEMYIVSDHDIDNDDNDDDDDEITINFEQQVIKSVPNIGENFNYTTEIAKLQKIDTMN